MSVLALGLNHASAPLDLRGRFAFAPEQIGAALASLRERLCAGSGAAPEAALLSTCNRTELYLVGDAAPRDLAAPAIAWLAQHGRVAHGTLGAHAFVAEDAAAARHVFRVAAGLDSAVLGEPQILGQMKCAVRHAAQARSLGSTLHQLFQRSFAVAKDVRTRTELGAHVVSVAATGVRLAGQLFEDLAALDVLFIGAGEMVELVATHFAAHRPRSITLANRSADRAAGLAAKLSGDGVGFGVGQAQAAARHGQRTRVATLSLAELPRQLQRFDVVVSCTASPLPLVGLGAVERALKARRNRPMLLLDLAVPRDIEPNVARLQDAFLYTLDDLAALAQAGGDKRRAAAAQAEAIVDAGVQGFAQWCAQRGSVPLIQALQTQADGWAHAEVQRALKRLARGAAIDDALLGLARGVAHKLLHGTLHALQDGDAAQRCAAGAAAQRLFLRQGSRCVTGAGDPARCA